MKQILLIVGVGVTTSAFAMKPLPTAGSGVPVNVLMCKLRADIESLLQTAYTSDNDAFESYSSEMQQSGRCTVGGGARIVAVDDQPFLINGEQNVHVLEVLYGGETYFTNFNR